MGEKESERDEDEDRGVCLVWGNCLVMVVLEAIGKIE